MNNDIIYLRAFELDDYKNIYKWKHDEELQKGTSGILRYTSSENERKWVEKLTSNSHTDIFLAICSKESHEMIGYLSIREIDYINRKAVGGGIVMGDRQFRDAFCTISAIQLMLSYVFDSLNLNRFTGACIVENKISRTVLELAGFKKEGEFKDAVYKDGKYHDQIQFAILKLEYDNYIKNDFYIQKNILSRFKQLKKQY